ncbi:EamA family transporter [Yersinia enterocolitica]|uniref:Membrane protein n=1 Tax=Yersinia enterocolitica serotype O:8 / biotype 1B (strain NCTC 13174 / 8081) TaxID=393305 RepID=A1JR07_YERE8|nr:EamA family transporter [Yersinia enterocolitica]AJJ25342.1 eamA-like transporter family protein [Yersinia enterocolitica]CAL13724.1 putative membrane protein [Yersinia enterocolitica subsp. enterocolitica 8081]CNF48293.1 permease of the drug/metabolite transporter (DMT) superfamily [Yersinia enterocolitica]HDL8279604.1 EamA family transporter [Yersinia enterocolitica]HDM8289449.1 EamA family transporter [Yersinia enterocolitica]
MKLTDFLIALLITAIWGVNFSIIKLGLITADPLILAGIRFTLCALPAVFFIKKPDTSWRYIIGYGLLFGIGLWGIVNLGIKAGVSAGIASLVLQFGAFFTLVLGALLFHENLSKYQYIGIIVALLGLTSIIFISDGSVTFIGLALVLCGAVVWGLVSIIIKKSDTKQVFSFLVWSSLFSPVPLFILSYLFNGPSGFTELAIHFNTTTLFSILFQVYPNTLFAYWVWNSLLTKYPVSVVAPLSLLVPIFGMLGSVMIFNERIPSGKVIAMIFIISGLIIGLYGKRLMGLLKRKSSVALIE